MNTRKIIAALASLTLMASAFSCGSTSSSSDSASSTPVTGTASNSESGSSAATEASTEGSNSGSEGTASTTSKTSSDKTESTTTAQSGEDTTSAPDEGTSENSATTAPSGGTAVTTTTKAPSGGNTVTTTAAVQTPDDDEEEEKAITAEVTLGDDITFTGENIELDGSTVKITAGGRYEFTGTLDDGQIYVNTGTEETDEDKVEIILSGVDIHSSSGPAILVDKSKNCTIKVKKDTVNNLSDESKDKINDGVIFSNDTLHIKGKGYLNITANNAHGIASDDDINIKNCICNITAKKTGILAHDAVTINSGKVNISAGTNGIKSSKEAVFINDGTVYISAGKKDDDFTIYGIKGVNYAGGYVYAAGTQLPDSITSVNPFITVDLDSATDEDTLVELSINGSKKASWAPTRSFSKILMLSPDIVSGCKFSFTLDGDEQDEFTVESGKNDFEI